MVQFISDILKFREQGEKTGWTYVEVPAVAIRKLKPGFKKSFRVKGKLDGFTIKGVALLPMGGGRFIMPINAAMRKGTGNQFIATGTKGTYVSMDDGKTWATLDTGSYNTVCSSGNGHTAILAGKKGRVGIIYF